MFPQNEQARKYINYKPEGARYISNHLIKLILNLIRNHAIFMDKPKSKKGLNIKMLYSTEVMLDISVILFVQNKN